MHRMLFYFLVVLCVGGNLAVAQGDGLPFPTAGRPGARITDEAIAADRAALRVLQSRMLALRERAATMDRYQLAKAQAWLEFAIFEYSQNDRTGVIEAATQQAILLLRGLEAGVSGLSRDTPIIRGSRLVRQDLWSQARVLAAADPFKCAEETIARLEVQLVLLGHEVEEADWHHAKRAEQLAEQLAAEAKRQIDLCPVPVVTAAPMPVEVLESKPLPLPVPPPVRAPTRVQVLEKIALSADALFAFDKADIADMSAAGKQQLDELANKMGQATRIEAILITGHTDRLGSVAVNQKRSTARARAVQQYLAARGVPVTSMQATGVGATKPIVTCKGNVATPTLIACLQANRRVDIEVRGVRAPEK